MYFNSRSYRTRATSRLPATTLNIVGYLLALQLASARIRPLLVIGQGEIDAVNLEH